MLRKMKFRGKRMFGSKNEWRYGPITGYDQGFPIIDNTVVDPDTVGQFTEWYDMTGAEIYEDDVLELTNEAGETVYPCVMYGTHLRTMDTGNLVEIKGFALMLGSVSTFPIINNYQGKNDLEIMKVIGNLHDGQAE